MDGSEENNGTVCISKRCMHVFHRVCIEQAIAAKRSCPLCRHQVGISDLQNNPVYAEECRAWRQNPSGYSLEAAFFKRYHFSPEERGMRSEDVLRPEGLHGQPWNPSATLADNMKFYTETVFGDYPQQEIQAAADVVITELERDFGKMKQDLVIIRQNRQGADEVWDRVNQGYDRIEKMHEEDIQGRGKRVTFIENLKRKRAELDQRKARLDEREGQIGERKDQVGNSVESANSNVPTVVKAMLFGGVCIFLGKSIMKWMKPDQTY